jgi:hypothetical protein
MNCAFITLGEKEVIDSQTAISEEQKVFVNTLILLPERVNGNSGRK